MLPNSDICSRNKIHALQVVKAYTIGHQGDTKASGVFQWPIGYYRDWLGVPEARGMFQNLDTCTRNIIVQLPVNMLLVSTTDLYYQSLLPIYKLPVYYQCIYY